ncbi:MAG TPA: response regulator [Candidatus Acidoferrum sp.]|nr:response regulator [Candidatus Acidoferrum sp.]
MARISAPKCILIVDNNASIRKIIRIFLEGEAGLKVCGEAVDGYDAIEKAEQLRPDLIILELALPRMSGLTAAQTLKKMSPRTPIILFTLYHDAFPNFVTPAGFDAVVEKRGDISLLMNSVQGLLQAAVRLPVPILMSAV